MFEYDPNWLRVGRTKLKRWREAFLNDTLPATNFEDKRWSHPFGWQWTKDEYPCKWCDFGQICREDHKLAVSRGTHIALSESAGVEDVQEVRETYTPARARTAVTDFWKRRNGHS